MFYLDIEFYLDILSIYEDRFRYFDENSDATNVSQFIRTIYSHLNKLILLYHLNSKKNIQ